MHQERRAAAALDERADRGPSGSNDQITLPVPGEDTILGLGRPSTENDIRGDVPLRLTLRPRSWLPERPASAQARNQFSFERATPLDE